MNKDYRKNQKVIATLELEDKMQDFLELDVLENGVILGNSIIFKDGRLTMIGVGSLDGKLYFTFYNLTENKFKLNLENLYIYIKETGEKDPLPWKAKTLNYKIIDVKKAKKPNRFINLK